MPDKAWLWIAALWTIVIAVLCLVSFGSLPDLGVKGTDKYVHATLHFFFTIFWCEYLLKNSGMHRGRIFGRILSLSIIYGCLIEIAQGCFTTTRQADLTDVAANFAGAAIAVLLLIVITARNKRLQE